MKTPALLFWWLAILWTYTEIVPRPFDDWKNGLLYVGAGVLVTVIAMKIKIAGGAELLPRGPRLRGDGRRAATGPAIFIFIAISYFLLCAVSTAIAPTGKYEGILELARLILWAGLAWVFAQCSVRTWIWLMRVTVISATTIAILTWCQGRSTAIWSYSSPFLSPIGHISYYGDFMALSLVMAVGLLSTFLGPRLKVGLSAGVTICCMLLIDVGLALSATRASLVGVIAAFLLAIPLVGLASRSFKMMGIIAAIGMLNLAVIFYLPIQSLRGEPVGFRLEHAVRTAETSIEEASGGRWHMGVTSAYITMKRPLLGWGVGTFRFVYPEYAHRNQQDSMVSSSIWCMHPHNEIMHQAVEVGWPGAILFVFGFGYLLYRGTKELDPRLTVPPSGVQGEDDGGKDANRTLLIMALCGLTVAFVSWQFSTNFLFPVSRLMTALFAGMILQLCYRESSAAIQSAHTGLLRGLRSLAMTTATLSTLLLAAYQISLICVQKQQAAKDVDSAQRYAAWAIRLAPGAFDPLYVRATVALRSEPPPLAATAVESLYAQYPYVPAVLHMMGYLRAVQGNIPEARELLQHALANDPGNDNAKQLLDQLPMSH